MTRRSLVASALLSCAFTPTSNQVFCSEISTFLFAGQDTTASAFSWALYALCKDKNAQDKLRAEFAEKLGGTTPTFDQLNSLPYLDAVVHETLRLHAPVSHTMRLAAKDTVIPLSEPILDSRGVRRNEIRLAHSTIRVRIGRSEKCVCV